MIRVRFKPTFDEWRRVARRLIADRIAPVDVAWNPDDAAHDVLSGLADDLPAGPSAATFSVPRGFIPLARTVARHRDPDRWALLYRALWRLLHENHDLLEIEVDEDVRALRRLEQEVHRDEHKMHAFVRFRRTEVDGHERYIAWYAPDHPIVEATAPFFVDRFRGMRWSILTPDRSAHWDGEHLTFTPGVPRSAAPTEDELEDLWRAYYGAVFNPARVNVDAMRREMPVRHWATLPEAAALPQLLADAPARVDSMLASKADAPSARPFVPDTKSVNTLREAAASCQGCDLYKHATQTVFGEGPRRARIMLVGEQPGDQEDVQGAPFVGPAGEVLNRALSAVGLARDDVYMTNAVKHFKWEPRGKRRIHQTPRITEIRACRPWLEAEIKTVQPAVIVCLGSTAAQSLMGPQFRITKSRGQVLASPWAPALVATFHPSAVLRADTPEAGDDIFRSLTSDLTLAIAESKKSIDAPAPARGRSRGHK